MEKFMAITPPMLTPHNETFSIYIDDDELNIARNHWLGSFQNDLSSSHSLISKFKSYYLYNLESDYLPNLYQRISTIDSSKIQSIAKKYLIASDMLLLC